MRASTGFHLSAVILALGLLLYPSPSFAQVHYDGPDHPWGQRAESGPDAEVDGWYFLGGLSGIRAQLLEDAPTLLLFMHVFQGSPADGKVRVGELLTGAGGQPFQTPHKNGYGMDRFGPTGPLLDFAIALEACQESVNKGRQDLTIERDRKSVEVTLKINRKYSSYGINSPGHIPSRTPLVT
ncbi:MAG: hypothetical protein ACJAVJ_001725 [Planctomycetota bacterium]|jgi:hypothetical protein